MGIHLDREDFLQGTTPPTSITPEFIGQIYIDTTHEIAYQNYNGRSDGWVQMAKHEHQHLPSEITGLDDYIDALLDQNYLNNAIQTLRTTGNQWTGLNNFTTLRVNSQDVLTTGSNLEDLGNVVADLSDATPGQVLGWNGSGWTLYNPDGTLPGGGGYDFTNFVTKNMITTSINSSSSTDVLAASAATAIIAHVAANYATIDHEHSEYALTGHTHTGYFQVDEVNTVTGNNVFTGELHLVDTDGTNKNLNISGDGGALVVRSTSDEEDSFKLEVDGIAGGKQSLYIGGGEETTANELILNFETVRIPTGRILTDDATGRIVFSPIKIETPNRESTKYVGGGYTRDYGLHLANTSMVGVNQIAFARASLTQTDGILFPKSFAGNTQPTEVGMYNYLYILDDLMHTDAALASTKNYIQLNGRKIFFSRTQPGREAKPGDVWIKI